MPDARRVPGWVWCIALLLHLPLLWLVVRHRAQVTPLIAPPRAITMNDAPTSFGLPHSNSAPRTPRGAAPSFMAEHHPAPTQSTAAPAQAVAEPAPAAPGPVAPPPPAASVGLRPRYGDGRLWIAPLPAAPREIAQALTGKSNAELQDSAVAKMIQLYLDQMANERTEHGNAPPSWTTKIGGKTVGVDQRWIYLGPLKIPTALLALLPLKVQANPTQAEFNARLELMREDLFAAARRSQNYDDFKQAIKDLHDQTEQSRQFRKNQRTAPDTSHHG